jgi:DNA-binding PadR family transcriptional regulator
MQLSTLCLGVLLSGPKTGYEMQRTINGPLGHFQHASLVLFTRRLDRLRRQN